jgi:ferrous iron transport protein B
MKLSELKTGEKGIVVKVLGHGGFRKRIVEMGFIKGKVVDVLLNAPLRDPVKYRIMGYEISLRHEEAALIEVMSTDEALKMKENNQPLENESNGTITEDYTISEEQLKSFALRQHRSINVALVGNPNCGKTSLFNFASGAHEHVGNYSGVTVDAKEGHFKFRGYDIKLIDLPGTYSLSTFSPEELYVRKQIIEKTPDIVINIIDANNLERNLYLTTQLVDMNLRMVCALNMYDELEESGDKLDYELLGRLFGVPMVPTVFRSGKGVEDLFKTVLDVYEGTNKTGRHIHINHGQYVEQGINAVKSALEKNEHIRHKYSLRYLSIKLLEMDSSAEKVAAALPNGQEVLEARDKSAQSIKTNTQEDSETAIMNAKYGFISGAMQEAFTSQHKNNTQQVTKVLDAIITNRWLGFPLFFVFLWFMFEVTFTVGQYPMDWIDSLVNWLSMQAEALLPAGPLKAMIVDGILGGVGAVIVFLPQILILYMFISIMEDSGYMARAAFIMDKIMHKMGLHGKSFIPLIMGFGCNVPAVMATRTIESKKSRLVTMLVLPMMSCSARLPIYIMITGAFFVRYQSLVMLSLYATGILLSVILSRIFSKYVVKGQDIPFVMELPPYRFPTAQAIWRHTWEKGKQYLKKMGGIILVAAIIIWFLGYYPNHDAYNNVQEQQENSYIGMMGKTVEPIFRPNGFDWKLDVALMSGVGAKEIVASTMGVLYAGNEETGGESLHDMMRRDGISPLAAFCFLLFVLIYFPCIATIAAIKQESGSWRWAAFAACYTTVLAWIVSALVYQIGSLFGL